MLLPSRYLLFNHVIISFLIIFLNESSLSKKIESITLLGSYSTLAEAVDVFIENDIAYVAIGLSGLQIIDVSNPYHPSLIGSFSESTVGSSATRIFGMNNLIYYTDLIGGLRIIDVSAPDSPHLIGSIDTQGEAWGVTVNNDIAYVADRYHGLTIIDVSNSSNPSFMSSFNTPNEAIGVTVNNDTAYVADFDGGLQIINVTNPYYPSLIRSYLTTDDAFDVTVIDDIAYIAADASGLLIINTSDSSNPSFMSSFDTPGAAWSVVVLHDIAYVADRDGGLQIIDVSNPYNPLHLGNYTTPGDADRVYVVNNIVYVAGGSGGFQIYAIRFHLPTAGIFILSFVDILIDYSFELSSFTISMLVVLSFSFFLLLVIIFTKHSLIYLSSYNFSKYYLLFSTIGLLNFISDIMLIIFLFISDDIILCIISLSIYLLSVLLSYFSSIRWHELLFKQANSDEIKQYISNNSNIYNYVFYLSIIINPNLLFILKCNLNQSFRFPIAEREVSIPIQCIIYDFYSLLPQSIILYYIAFQTPLEWNILFWIIILFKFLNQILSIVRISSVLYYGGGKSRIKVKEIKSKKDGIFKTVKMTPVPGLKSITESKFEVTSVPIPSLLSWATFSRRNLLKPEASESVLEPSISVELQTKT